MNTEHSSLGDRVYRSPSEVQSSRIMYAVSIYRCRCLWLSIGEAVRVNEVMNNLDKLQTLNAAQVDSSKMCFATDNCVIFHN